MLSKRKIKVLIVDDSIVFREILSKKIGDDFGIEVVGLASDAYEARDLIIKCAPDVMTLDVEMPKMNGIEFLKRLMPQYPIPVIVISGVSVNVLDALNAGAVDFVPKPDYKNNRLLELFFREVIIKLKIASVAKVGHFKNNKGLQVKDNKVINIKSIVAIGASTGGTEAIYSILNSLPQNMPPILIVQHMPAKFTKMYADRLNNKCKIEVKEAENGDAVIPGRVLIAPGDYHMILRKTVNNYFVECFKGEKVNGHCPSVDKLFFSVANTMKKDAIGIILTGMGYDGAKGLYEMRKQGAKTIGQDENSCVVYGMPKVAYDIGAVDIQCDINAISETLLSVLQGT